MGEHKQAREHYVWPRSIYACGQPPVKSCYFGYGLETGRGQPSRFTRFGLTRKPNGRCWRKLGSDMKLVFSFSSHLRIHKAHSSPKPLLGAHPLQPLSPACPTSRLTRF